MRGIRARGILQGRLLARRGASWHSRKKSQKVTAAGGAAHDKSAQNVTAAGGADGLGKAARKAKRAFMRPTGEGMGYCAARFVCFPSMAAQSIPATKPRRYRLGLRSVSANLPQSQAARGIPAIAREF